MFISCFVLELRIYSSVTTACSCPMAFEGICAVYDGLESTESRNLIFTIYEIVNPHVNFDSNMKFGKYFP